MANIQDIVKDPDFIGLPIEEKKKVFAHFDSDFTTLAPEEQDKVVAHYSTPQWGWKNTVSAVARPTLEGLGMVGGGMVGTSAGPVGTAGGATLGFAGGKAAADLLDRGLGLKEPIKNIPEAISETGNDLKAGAEAEATGRVLGPVLSGVGKVAKGTLSAVAKVSPEEVTAMMKKPIDFFFSAPTKAEAEKVFGDAVEQAGIRPRTPEEIYDPESNKSLALNALDKARKLTAGSEPGDEAATELLHGKQANQAIVNAAKMVGDEAKKRAMTGYGKEISNALYELAPVMKGADKVYSDYKLADSFRSLPEEVNALRKSEIISNLLRPAAGATLPTVGKLVDLASTPAAKSAVKAAIAKYLGR